MQQPGSPTSSASNDNLISGLCYIISLVSIGVLFIAPYSTNPAVRFHALQSIFLSLGWAVVLFASFFIMFIPFVNILFIFLFPLGVFAILIVHIVLAVKAFQGKGMELPVVSDWAKRFA